MIGLSRERNMPPHAAACERCDRSGGCMQERVLAEGVEAWPLSHRSGAQADCTLRLSTTPGMTSCSRPLYSPSVFSRMVIRLTSSYLRASMHALGNPCMPSKIPISSGDRAHAWLSAQQGPLLRSAQPRHACLLEQPMGRAPIQALVAWRAELWKAKRPSCIFSMHGWSTAACTGDDSRSAPGLVAGDGEAGAHVGVQLQLLAQRQVQAAVALADGRRHGPLQAHLVFLASTARTGRNLAQHALTCTLGSHCEQCQQCLLQARQALSS